MKYWLIVAQFYASDRQLRRCRAQFGAVLARAGVLIEEVLVDMRAPVGQEAGNEPFPFLDVSGYFAGLERVPQGAPVIVLNDTFFTKHPWRSYTKSLARVLKVLASRDHPCAAGAVFPTQSLLLLDEQNPSRRHVCTFLVAVNPAGRIVLDELGSSLPGPQEDEVEQWLRSIRTQHPALSSMLDLHFAREPNPWQWPGMAGEPTDRLVQRKAVTVVFEYLFSSRLLACGGMVLPINAGTRQWIAEQCERLWLRTKRHLKVLPA